MSSLTELDEAYLMSCTISIILYSLVCLEDQEYMKKTFFQQQQQQQKEEKKRILADSHVL